jgi:hypothetical protein
MVRNNGNFGVGKVAVLEVNYYGRAEWVGRIQVENNWGCPHVMDMLSLKQNPSLVQNTKNCLAHVRRR